MAASADKARCVDHGYHHRVSKHLLRTSGDTFEGRTARFGDDERVPSESGRWTRQHHEGTASGSDAWLADHSPAHVRQSLLAAQSQSHVSATISRRSR